MWKNYWILMVSGLWIMIIMIYSNLSAAITENNLWFIECWQIYPTNIARNKWEYDLKILFYKKKNTLHLCFHSFCIEFSDFRQGLIFLLTSQTTELLVSVLEDLQLNNLSGSLVLLAVLQLEDKSELKVGGQRMVESLSIEQFCSVSPELRLMRPF